MSEPSYEQLRVDLEETRKQLELRESRLRELGVTDWEPKPVAEEKVVIELCHQVRENGYHCGSPAVTDRRYCRHHLSLRGRRLKMARARARRERYVLELPPPDDLYAVQVGIGRVLDALAAGQLDRRMGSVMLSGLRQAAANLRLPQGTWEESVPFDRVGKTTWGGFEQAHGLPEGFDIDTPPEVAFPPPLSSPGVIELTGEDHVTEDDIELEELLARDPEACKRRAMQLARKYRRRLHHEEEKLARACRILEAALRNDEARKKEPASVKAEAGSGDGSSEQGTSAIGGEAKKPPQGEPDPNKEDELAKGASQV